LQKQSPPPRPTRYGSAIVAPTGITQLALLGCSIATEARTHLLGLGQHAADALTRVSWPRTGAPLVRDNAITTEQADRLPSPQTSRQSPRHPILSDPTATSPKSPLATRTISW